MVILDKYAEGASVYFDIFIRIHSICKKMFFVVYLYRESGYIFNPSIKNVKPIDLDELDSSQKKTFFLTNIFINRVIISIKYTIL